MPTKRTPLPAPTPTPTPTPTLGTTPVPSAPGLGAVLGTIGQAPVKAARLLTKVPFDLATIIDMEGFRGSIWDESVPGRKRKVPTVGFGFNVRDTKWFRDNLPKDILSGKRAMTHAEGLKYLTDYTNRLKDDINWQFRKTIKKWSPGQRAAVLDMFYQHGQGNLQKKAPKVWAALKRGDVEGAADAYVTSPLTLDIAKRYPGTKNKPGAEDRRIIRRFLLMKNLDSGADEFGAGVMTATSRGQFRKMQAAGQLGTLDI